MTTLKRFNIVQRDPGIENNKNNGDEYKVNLDKMALTKQWKLQGTDTV